TNNNGGMNFNGFGRGGLVLTVPQGWTVALHFKNEDPNLPHSVEVIPEAAAIPTGPVPPAFEHATTGRLEQGFSTGQGAEIRFAALGVGAEGALHARAPRRRTRRRGAWLGQAHVPVACFGVPSRVGAPSPDPSATHRVVQRFPNSRVSLSPRACARGQCEASAR